MQDKTQREYTDRFLRESGIAPHLRGTYFLKCAAEIASDDPSLLDYLQKGLYSTIAEKTGTTVSCVERNIRYALRHSADTNRTFLMKLAGQESHYDHGRTGQTHQRTGEKK